MADFLDRESQAYDEMTSETKQMQEKMEAKRQADEQLKAQQEAKSEKDNEFLGGAMEFARQGFDPKKPFDNVGGAKGSAAMGVLDTAMDAIGTVGELVPWLSPLSDLDDSYDAKFGRETEEDTAKRIVRDISATVIPTLTIGGAVAGSIKASAASKVMLSSRTHLIGRIGAEAAVGTAVTAVSDQSEEQDNLATLVSELTGLDIPWRHVDGDSPYWTFTKNMVEDAFFNIGGAALEAYTASRSITKHLPKNEEAAQYLGEKIAPLAAAREELGDPVSAAVKVKDDARLAEINRETIQRLGQNADNPNPYYGGVGAEPDFGGGRQFNDTRGQGQYFHGSARKFDLAEGGEFTGGQNIYGDGLYVTDDIQTAQSYTKKNKKQAAEDYDPSLYNVEINDANFYDLDQPADKDVLASLREYVDTSNYNSMVDLLDDVLSNVDETASLGSIMDGIRVGSRSYEVPDYEVLEFFEDIIKAPLVKKGFKGFTHVGGNKAGKGKRNHQVSILWDPAANAKINPANLDDFSTPTAPPKYDPFLNEPHTFLVSDQSKTTMQISLILKLM